MNAKGHDSYTVLIIATRDSRSDMVKFLLDHGASVNGITNNGVTALMYAAGSGLHRYCRTPA